jgi:CheY-like chemotaxis protein
LEVEAVRIAIADDQPGVTDLNYRALTDLGHEVFVACDGRQLVELCRRERPDLIITDWQMPQMDVLAAVRQVQQEGPVPAILVTADDVTRNDLTACVRLVLSKPILLSDLVEAVSVLVRKAPKSTPEPAVPRTEPGGP